MKKGKPIQIFKGTYKGTKAWVDSSKEPSEHKRWVVVEINGREIAKNIYKTSFTIKTSLANKPQTITECLLNDNPKVRGAMLEVAELVARLGIVEADVSSVIFKEMVEDSIDRLSQNPMAAKYFPIKLASGDYRSFFCDSLNSGAGLKRTFQDKNEMKDD